MAANQLPVEQKRILPTKEEWLEKEETEEERRLFDFCCARESFCPRDIVLIWFDEKTAGGV